MGLIIEGPLLFVPISPPNAVMVALSVPKNYLSTAYELPDFITIIGEILEVKKVRGELSRDDIDVIKKEIVGKRVEFILYLRVIGTNDWLFISKVSWTTLRDCAILPGEYSIKVRLIEAKHDEKSVEIYPKREVSV